MPEYPTTEGVTKVEAKCDFSDINNMESINTFESTITLTTSAYKRFCKKMLGMFDYLTSGHNVYLYYERNRINMQYGRTPLKNVVFTHTVSFPIDLGRFYYLTLAPKDLENYHDLKLYIVSATDNDATIG